jgi:hypothetical protein
MLYAFGMSQAGQGAIAACLLGLWIFVSDDWDIWITSIGILLITGVFALRVVRRERS